MPDQQQLMIQQFKAYCARCHTPRQFHKLLEDLRRLLGKDRTQRLPLACGWGYPNIASITGDGTHAFAPEIVCVRSMDFPLPYLNWYRTSGEVVRDRVFLEWLKTGRPQIWSEVARKYPKAFSEAIIKKVKDFNLSGQLAGGWIFGVDHGQSFKVRDLSKLKDVSLAYFTIALESELECRKYIELFAELLPSMGLALKNSYSTPTLTPKRLTILKYIALGCSHKEIAHSLKITESAVKDHRRKLLKTLNAENDANAVLIALIEKVLKPSLYF
jgi:DNA-binding CsgD family transcriptional regulator